MSIIGGPMGHDKGDRHTESIFDRDGSHYNIFRCRNPDLAMEWLRKWFPSAEANEYAFALFSTSGVHGTYTTIEEVEYGLRKYGEISNDEELPDDYHGIEVTFVVVEPRIVRMTYGSARARTEEDVAFLRRLRESSWRAATSIGASREIV